MRATGETRRCSCAWAALVVLLTTGCGDDGATPSTTTGAGASGGSAPTGGSGGSAGGGGAGGAGGGGAAESGIHLVHAGLGTASVQLCIDGSPVGAEVAAGEASARAAVGEGVYTVRAAAAGGCDIAVAPDVSVELATAKSFESVVLYGDGSAMFPLTLAPAEITYGSPFGGLYRRFFHAAPGAGQLDLGDEVDGAYESAFINAPYGGEGLVVPIGVPGYVGQGAQTGLTMIVRDGGTDAVLATTTPVDLLDDSTYTVIATGDPNALGVLLCTDLPGPACSVITR